jgi:excisionase family DNA binding protein
MVEREWYRPEEAAEALGLSRSQTYRLLNKAGGIPSTRVAGVVRVPVAALRAWAAGVVAAGAAPSDDRLDTDDARR